MKKRNSCGQGLAESACGTVIFVVASVLLVMLGVNVYTICTYDKELSQIASECSKNVGESSFYLGMERPTLSAPQEMKARATRIAADLAHTLAFPESPSIEVQQGVLPDHSILCTVSASAEVPLPYSFGIFPKSIKLKRDRSYVSFSFGPMALANLVDSNNNGVQIPAYFYFTRVGNTIIRDKFGGGAGRFNMSEDGTYFGGCVFAGVPGSMGLTYFKGSDGQQRSAVPAIAGATHGFLPVNQQFSAQ